MGVPLCMPVSQKFKRLCVFSTGARTAKPNERRIVATTDQTVSGVPGRYASALFELSSEEKATEEVSRQLHTFQTAIDQSEDLRRLVADFGASLGVSGLDGLSGGSIRECRLTD